jgi:hypothetical protein
MSKLQIWDGLLRIWRIIVHMVVKQSLFPAKSMEDEKERKLHMNFFKQWNGGKILWERFSNHF